MQINNQRKQQDSSFTIKLKMIDLIKNLSNLRLLDMKRNDDICDELIDQLPLIRDIDTDILNLALENNEVTNEIIIMEEEFNKLKETLESKIEQVEALQQKVIELTDLQEEKIDIISPKFIMEGLKDKAAESDRASEKIAAEFLNKDIDVEDFLELFIAERMVGHIRKVKEEKFEEQLDELFKAGF